MTPISLKEMWSEGLQMGWRGQIPWVTEVVLVFKSNDHKFLSFNWRSVVSLKRISAAHLFPRARAQHKDRMDCDPGFTCSWGSGWAPEGALYSIVTFSGGNWSILILYCGNLVLLFLLLCFVWDYTEDTSFYSFRYSLIQHWGSTTCKALGLNSGEIKKYI